jgi:hypothetical protein
MFLKTSPPAKHNHQQNTTTNITPPPSKYHHKQNTTTNKTPPSSKHHHQQITITSKTAVDFGKLEFCGIATDGNTNEKAR